MIKKWEMKQSDFTHNSCDLPTLNNIKTHGTYLPCLYLCNKCTFWFFNSFILPKNHSVGCRDQSWEFTSFWFCRLKFYLLNVYLLSIHWFDYCFEGRYKNFWGGPVGVFLRKVFVTGIFKLASNWQLGSFFCFFISTYTLVFGIHWVLSEYS